MKKIVGEKKAGNACVGESVGKKEKKEKRNKNGSLLAHAQKIQGVDTCALMSVFPSHPHYPSAHFASSFHIGNGRWREKKKDGRKDGRKRWKKRRWKHKRHVSKLTSNTSSMLAPR